MAKEKRAFWRKWVWKHLLAGITVLAMSSAAVGKDIVPDEARTRDMMRCQDYLQLDPRAWTPMVIWLMNDPFSLEPPEWTDFHEAELVLTPILTEICRQEPDVWLTSLRERLNSYQQVRSLN
ncbi:HdeA/HdeB family chaperone [Klebsiella pneumoniae]|jgi:acid stress chaperone HdeB|uniref:HdeB family protein n=1 Tax=Klebsiella pneumoniae subsp. pneumoniae TaxID=72407 RepID=A0A4S4YQR2_KLEPN|nr:MULTISPECIES: HdeA/HdeB family chaperone [Klebsiella]HAJ3457499.1 hdeB family protein [Escherichia coli]APP33601.1 hdeB family protein [Klebsiella pneumoniae]APP45190.1 hdeB family protein [Klebsiella pneumoniae]APP51060.1 hdeB family protein [Klebsiella pneumoniae]APP56927.1 hdeB family protein [Klebsiella pneumoniae]